MPGRRQVPPCGHRDVRPPLPAHTGTTYCPNEPIHSQGEKKYLMCRTIWRVGMVMLQHCVDGIEADCRVLPRRVSLVSRCHTLLPVNLYCATPPQVIAVTAGILTKAYVTIMNCWWLGGRRHWPRFIPAGKLVSAHRADGLPPYMGGVPSERGVEAGGGREALRPPLPAQMGFYPI